MTESNWLDKICDFIDWLASGKKYSLRIVPSDVEHAMLGLVVYEYCGELEELACHLCDGKYDEAVREDKRTVDNWLMQSRGIRFTFFSLLLTATIAFSAFRLLPSYFSVSYTHLTLPTIYSV